MVGSQCRYREPVCFSTRCISTSRGAMLTRYAMASFSPRSVRNAPSASATRGGTSPAMSDAYCSSVVGVQTHVSPKACIWAASDAAQIQAFGDTWVWTPTTDEQYASLMAGEVPPRVADAVGAFRTLLGENDAMAYLVNMAPRLVEMHRVLKQTGSLYLHCDPTMSHYLKVLLDGIFGPQFFRNELIWKRTSSHSSAKKYAPVHDVILYYSKSKKLTWNTPRTGYDEEYLDKYYHFDDGDGRLYWRADLCAAGTRNGRSGVPWHGLDPTAKGMHWKFAVETLDDLDKEGRIYWAKGGQGWPQYKRYRDELKGLVVSDIWTDIDHINPVAAERLGYPTQKPIALMERILEASSNPGDVVLDPFCGCGTTVDAAQRLGRTWLGIDVTYIAIDLI